MTSHSWRRSRQTAEQQSGIAHRIDPHVHAAPFEREAFAGGDIFEGCDVAAVARHADLDIAERQPEFVDITRQRDDGDDAVGLIERFLDEADHVTVLDGKEAQICRSVAAPRFPGAHG